MHSDPLFSAYSTVHPGSETATAGVADNPITRSSEDLLQRDDVAGAVAENLR